MRGKNAMEQENIVQGTEKDWTKQERETIERIVTIHGQWFRGYAEGVKLPDPMMYMCGLIRPDPRMGRYKLPEEINENSKYSDCKERIEWLRHVSKLFKEEEQEPKRGHEKDLGALLKDNPDIVSRVLTNLEADKCATLTFLQISAERHLKEIPKINGICDYFPEDCYTCFYHRRSEYCELLKNNDLPENIRIDAGKKLFGYLAFGSFYAKTDNHRRRIDEERFDHIIRLAGSDNIPAEVKELARKHVKKHYEGLAKKYS